MKVNNSLTQVLAVSTLAIGASVGFAAAPAHAVFFYNSDIAFGTGVPSFYGDVNPTTVVNDTITVNFVNPTIISSVSGTNLTSAPFFSAGAGSYSFVGGTPPTAVFNYVSGNDVSFAYALASNLNFNFANGANLVIAAGTQFNGSRNSSSTAFSTINTSGSFFRNGTDITPLNALSFGFTDIFGAGNGGYTIQASTGSPTAVPEPFTIVGTIVGASAALRMRKKLADATKN
jgi:hypothetical protein